ncbi:MAG: hypothetical protein LBG70_00715 [Bifidobacteriaceae bacterium]|jgi:hypothetical protein|nr:hypothetical protein [Bifidobacteriaceae bacterium]
MTMPIADSQPVIVLTGDQHLANYLLDAANQAGLLSHWATTAACLEELDGQPRALIRGLDVDPLVAQTVTARWPDCPIVEACLGSGSGFSLPQQQEILVSWLEGLTMPQQRSQRLAVVGTGGGVGASTLALALAYQLAEVSFGGVNLVDLDPVGTPLSALAGLTTEQPGWAQVMRGDCPPSPPGGVCLLGGARVLPAQPALIRQCVEALEARRARSVTIFDACPVAPVRLVRLANWCDQIVLVADNTGAGVTALQTWLTAVADLSCQVIVALRCRRSQPVPVSLGRISNLVIFRQERRFGRTDQQFAQSGGSISRAAKQIAQLARLTAAASEETSQTTNSIGEREVIWPKPPPVDNAATQAVMLGVVPSAQPKQVKQAETEGVFVGAVTGPDLTRRQRQLQKPLPVNLYQWDEQW